MKLAPLSQLKPQSIAKIENFSKEVVADSKLTKHLSDMGFVKGQDLKVANRTKDLLIVKVGNGNAIGIDNNIASIINVLTEDKFISTKMSKEKKNILKKLIGLFKKSPKA